MERIRQLNSVLPDLIATQFIWLIIGSAAIVCAGINVPSILPGYAVGSIYSAVSIVHMAVIMNKAMYYEEKGAVARTLGGYFVRLFLLFAMEAVLYFAGGISSVFASIAGMFMMKVSAYIQPFTHKLFKKIKGKGGKESGQSNDECSGS